MYYVDYVCMYVCVYVCTYVCMYVFMYVMYVCTYVCMCVCMYVCMCMYVYVCVYVCMYVCVYVCMWICVCMYVCMCVCMYVCVCVCTYTYLTELAFSSSAFDHRYAWISAEPLSEPYAHFSLKVTVSDGELNWFCRDVYRSGVLKPRGELPRLQNFIRWHLIFIGPHYETCCVSPLRCLEFWGGSYFSKICAPLYCVVEV